MTLTVLQEVKKPRPMDEQADFVMEHVDRAVEDRSQFIPVWDEAEENFLVRPHVDSSLATNTFYPVSNKIRDFSSAARRGRAVLKDPETHQVVMSLISGIILSIAPDGKFIRAGKTGFEDVFRGKVASELLEYDFRLEGTYWAMFEWLLGAGIPGTGIMEAFWDYVEEPREFRTIEVDPLTGGEFSVSQILMSPVWDDVRLEAFDIRSFYPDTSTHLLNRMKGAAREFSITAKDALAKAEAGIYKKDRVNAAIDRKKEDSRKAQESRGDDEIGLYPPKEFHPDFLEMKAFRYCGQTPFESEDGFDRHEIVVLNGETVRSEIWPRRLPWFDCKITPRPGSFYGVSPAELIRYDQDFADILKMMLSDAVVRMTHPPHIYEKSAGVELAKLRAFKPEVPIGVDRMDAIKQVEYKPPVEPAFAMYAGVKQQMRESTSATDPNQGFGIGTKRLSASEALGTFERAGVRPEMFNRVMEHVWLPPMGKYMLELNQQFLEDTEDLQDRIGESEAVVSLAEIMPDFDVKFVGSTISSTKEEKLQAFREIITAAANPAIAPLLPIIPLLRKFFEELGAHEIAAMVGNPEMMQLNIMLSQMTSTTSVAGNGNGTTPSAPSPGALPAQLFGGPQING